MAEVNPDWNIKVRWIAFLLCKQLKFAIVEPGWHATSIFEHTVSTRTPVHPAYVGSPSMLLRAEVDAKPEDPALQDVDKATAALYEFIQLEDRPLRLPLGKDTLESVKERIKDWHKTYQFCRRFSDDLLRDNFKRREGLDEAVANWSGISYLFSCECIMHQMSFYCAMSI
ncbi:hypothetical protein J3R83DRAFT_5380 [Lanmaoa asiatica]|nr:hypothetical protein J3R83DRAFT_5380 [Lanmaoa asiatica]